MKKLKTLSEFEVISAAWYYYLDQWLKYKEALELHPNNGIIKIKYNKVKAIEEELHAVILKIEQKQDK